MARVHRLLEQQSRELERLLDDEARRMRRTFDDARRELREELAGLVTSARAQTTPYTAQWTRTMLVQAEAAERALRRRLGDHMDRATDRQQRAALDSLLKTIRKFEPNFAQAAGMIEIEALRRMTAEQGLLLHRYSVERYGADMIAKMQRELTTGIARGMSIPQLRDRLAAPGGVIDGMKARAELIVRMEVNSAFNRYHLDAMKATGEVVDADKTPGDPNRMRKRANEFTDLRNHAISRVLHGQVVDFDEPLKAPRAKVLAEHETIQRARVGLGLKRRRLGGIVWPLVGANYEGQNYPAHFWERGRITPWRESWDDDLGEV